MPQYRFQSFFHVLVLLFQKDAMRRLEYGNELLVLPEPNLVTSCSQVKGLLLTAVIGAPALACVLKIIELGGRYFYIYVWGFMFAFSVVMLTITPVLIMPLFNKYTPLEVSMRHFRICDYGFLCYECG